MTANGWLQFLLLFVVLVALMRPLGLYMARVFQGEPTFADPLLKPVERLLYRLFGVRSEQEMTWGEYTISMLLFNFVSMLLTYAIERVQHWLPSNPQHLSSVAPDLAWNTAASFTTNTNWQSYVPETTMSYFTQMVGLAYHNFLSAAVGIAVAIALVRGIARKEAKTIGNFWVDATQSVLYVLLPLCIVYAGLLIQQGVIQNLKSYTTATTVEHQTQTIPQGPVASQEAIKMLGTNGGGFFNANSAHPFENPTPFTNFLEMLAIFLIPAALTVTLGRMVGKVKQGIAIAAAMALVVVVGIFIVAPVEKIGNPAFTRLGLDQSSTGTSPGGNMEGKEVRFGPILSGTFATVTTDTSTGAVDSFHDSFTPLGGLVPLVNI